MNVTLIRHAESEANVGIRTNDPYSIKLTENGHRSAKDLVDRIYNPPDLIIVTPYHRTKQTAFPLIQKYSNVPVEEWALHEFTFLSPELCVNTTMTERLPMVEEYWALCNPSFRHGTGAETFEEFDNRITKSVYRLKSLRHTDIVVFTHGLVMKYVKQLEDLGPMPAYASMKHFRDRMLKFPVANVEMWKYQF